MIDLFDHGFRITSAFLRNRCKNLTTYNKIFCFGCGFDDRGTCFAVDHIKSNIHSYIIDNDNSIDKIDQQSSFSNSNRYSKSHHNRRTCFSDSNDNIYSNIRSSSSSNNNTNSIDTIYSEENIYHGTSIADSNSSSYSNSESDSDSKRYSKRDSTISSNNISDNDDYFINIIINKDLKLWLAEDDILVDAIFLDNFRCIISGSSEYGY